MCSDHLEVINLGGVFATCPQAGVDDPNQAVEAAKGAFPAWAVLADTDRVEPIRRLGDLVEQHASELSALITRERGKSQSGPGPNFGIVVSERDREENRTPDLFTRSQHGLNAAQPWRKRRSIPQTASLSNPMNYWRSNRPSALTLDGS